MSSRTRRWLSRALVVLAVVGLASCGDDAPAPSERSAPKQVTDHALVTELFELLHDKDLEGLDEYLSPAFQLQRTDGSHVTKAEYLQKPATVDHWEIHDVTGTRYGNTRIIRFVVTSDSLINGKRTVQEAAPRLSTFTWNGSRWQLAAHANYVALHEGESTPPAEGDVTDLVLVSRLFELLKTKDRAALAAFLHPAFQLGRSDGSVLTRDDYLANPATVVSYENVSLDATEVGDMRVIRSTFRTTALIDGKQLTSDPIPFLSTFVWSDGRWQLLSHANFGPLPK
jgi:hypothetical protein